MPHNLTLIVKVLEENLFSGQIGSGQVFATRGNQLPLRESERMFAAATWVVAWGFHCGKVFCAKTIRP